jgi:hypothetical protein
MRIVITLLGVVALAGGSAQATTVQSGLFGQVTRGPITPVCIEGQPCTAPAPGVLLVFSRSGHEVGRVRTRTDGTYRVALTSGAVHVRASGKLLEPVTAWVPRDRFHRVDFSIDTGIR